MRWLALVALVGCGRYHFDRGDDGGANLDGNGALGDSAPDGPVAGVNFVFVSSSTILPASLGGVGGADAICMTLATQASLPGTYVAWLSSLSSNAVDRLQGARGWQRRDGRPFATSVEELAVNRWFHPIIVDENGSKLEGVSIVTNSNVNGQILGTNDCSGFSANVGPVNGTNNVNGASYWTLGAAYSCDTPLHLYCFGIDYQTQVSPPSTGTVRRAFVTNTGWTPGGGITSADAACQAEANTNGISGTFQALLGQMGATPVARFNLGGAPWVRLDGTPIVDTAAALGMPYLVSSLHQSPSGYIQGFVSVWFGAATVQTAGDAASTCNDWMSNQMTATGNSTGAGAMGPYVIGSGGFTCNNDARLFCLEI